MMKGATPLKQNQGTEVRQQKIYFGYAKILFLTEYADWYRINLICGKQIPKIIFNSTIFVIVLTIF